MPFTDIQHHCRQGPGRREILTNIVDQPGGWQICPPQILGSRVLSFSISDVIQAMFCEDQKIIVLYICQRKTSEAAKFAKSNQIVGRPFSQQKP